MYVYHLRVVAVLKAKIRKVRKIFDELAKNGFCNTQEFRKKNGMFCHVYNF